MGDYEPSPSFEAYLHNPWGYPSLFDRAAIKILKNREAELSGVAVRDVATEGIVRVFDNGDNHGPTLEDTGLRTRYETLSEYITSSEYGIACMVFLAYIRDPRHIASYTTTNEEVIELTDQSIARELIREHLGTGKTHRLMRELPGFERVVNELKQLRSPRAGRSPT